jgi:uncharacterized protein (TIGR02284 family)
MNQEDKLNDDKVLETLNQLIQTSEDGAKGFAQAAEKAQDVALKSELGSRAQLCAKATRDLQSLVRSFGGDPQKGGTVSGTLHRRWLAFKAAVGDNDVAVLEEVERGEDHAKAVYARALEEQLPFAVKSVVEDQYQHVLRNHDRVRSLREQYRRAA